MRLLIMACSASKRRDDELLPVIDRYDGPTWRLLRAFKRQQPLLAETLDVYAFSAEFGLIEASKPIPNYERLLTSDRAVELSPHIAASFAEFAQRNYFEICLAASQRYLVALRNCQSPVPVNTRVTIATGSMGFMQSKLRAWLYEQEWAPPAERSLESATRARRRGQVTIAGVSIKATREELFAMARESLSHGDSGAQRYRDWYVLLDDQPVAPKWLISLATKLPTTEFDASAARRALLGLGIHVERVR